MKYLEPAIAYLVFLWRNSKMEVSRCLRVFLLGKDECACVYADLLAMMDDECFPEKHIHREFLIFQKMNSEKWRMESLLEMMKDRRPTLHERLKTSTCQQNALA